MRVPYAGQDRPNRHWHEGSRPHRKPDSKPTPAPPMRAPSFVARRPAPAGRYLRELRGYIAGTPGLTAGGIVDKIDDLIFRADLE